MRNDIAISDDRKSVERWENEGGRVSPNQPFKLGRAVA